MLPSHTPGRLLLPPPSSPPVLASSSAASSAAPRRSAYTLGLARTIASGTLVRSKTSVFSARSIVYMSPSTPRPAGGRHPTAVKKYGKNVPPSTTAMRSALSS